MATVDERIAEVEQELEQLRAAAAAYERVQVPGFAYGLLKYREPDAWLVEVGLKELATIKSFRVRADDVFVSTFPKSGTTWMQEITYLLANDCDVTRGAGVNLDERAPELAYPFAKADKLASPRVLKTHWCYSELPDDVRTLGCRVIHVVRNPKDACVSYYHYLKFLLVPYVHYAGDFDSFARLFLEGKLPFGSSWFSHTSQCASNPHALIVHFEDLVRNPHENIRRIAAYMGKEVSDEQVALVERACSFDKLRASPTSNYAWQQAQGLANAQLAFFRKGQVGDWTNYFSEELSAAFDEAVRTRCTYTRQPFDYGLTHEEFVRMKRQQQQQQQQASN